MADRLEWWGIVGIGVGAVLVGLASLAEAAFERFAWTEIAIGVGALVLGVVLLMRAKERHKTGKVDSA